MSIAGYHFRICVEPRVAVDVFAARATALAYSIRAAERLTPRFELIMLAGTVWLAYERGGDLLQVLGTSTTNEDWSVLIPQMGLADNLFVSFGLSDPSVREMTRNGRDGPLSTITTATQDLALAMSWDGVGFRPTHSQEQRQFVFPIDVRRCLQ